MTYLILSKINRYLPMAERVYEQGDIKVLPIMKFYYLKINEIIMKKILKNIYIWLFKKKISVNMPSKSPPVHGAFPHMIMNYK